MKRRTFLKGTAPALALPLAIHGMRFNAMAHTSALNKMLAAADSTDRVLVIVQLEGGNDGLNTVIPIEDDIYHNSRPTIGINKADALELTGQPLLRFHPSMPGMQQMFNDGRMGIVTNIGYSNYSLSHFSGIEIWNTGTESSVSEQLGTGWIGRYLEDEFPGYPTVLPNDPPAIQIRPSTSSMFNIESSTMGVALTDPVEFYALVNGSPVIDDDLPPNTLPGKEWQYIRAVDTQAMEYSRTIREAALKAQNSAQYPETGLAQALAIVARLIAGGLSTRVYMVSLGSFDTHGDQAVHQAGLLQELSGALKAFNDDTIALGIDQRVVGMTYSEFGRRIVENASGTDHGAAAPHFVFGSPIDGGKVFGGMPDLAHPDESGNLVHERTFQCYYASVLAPLFRLPESRVRTILPYGLCDADERVNIYRSSFFGVPTEAVASAMSLRNLPNPASTETTFHYQLARPGHVQLEIYDVDGRMVMQAVDEYQEAGACTVKVELSSLPPATYLYELKTGGTGVTNRMVVVR